jgi:hypothetical protein
MGHTNAVPYPVPLTNALEQIHKRFPTLKIRMDTPTVAGIYMIDLFREKELVVVIVYDPRRDQKFGWNDAINHDISFAGADQRLTNEIADLLDWTAAILTPA